MKTHFKQKPTKLSKAEYKALRVEIWNDQYCACFTCGRFCEFEKFHLHHKKSRGAGGGDDKDNLAGICWECHRKIHDGIIRYRGVMK